ncbi:mRNA-decapping enzyme subunit 1 protein [Dioscorea alata]|uniref:mRNA-decapping enzyme subunit 1 protein n=1 Tax=Dioscorea alata TaxID=55571 RepID=A0ACB7VCF1_DIOAL|nr:mRNA-decapping enzyme subunit 1 protein [Dioscorea alata]
MGHGKLIPELDHRGTKALNLTVLQRIDPFIDEILLTVSHVSLYKFNLDSNQWSRRDVEGSLFVIKRNSQPRFQFLVMNRRNTENLAEDILGDFEYDVQPPYLLYRNVAQEINGIWFYKSEESEAVANLFSRIACAFSKQPLKPTPSASPSEFKELEAVPSSVAIEGPLEPLTSSAATISDAPRDLISNLFSAAKLARSESSSAVSGKQHQAFEPPSSIDQSFSLCPSLLPTLQQATRPPSTFSPLMPYVNSKESTSSPLIRPLFTPSSSSSLLPQLISSSSAVAPPVYPSGTMQHPYGTPLFQPFPSLAPASSLGSVITKEQIHNAFLKLVQNDQFIEMVYQELWNAHDT